MAYQLSGPMSPNATVGITPRPINPFLTPAPPPTRNAAGFPMNSPLPPRTGEAMLAPIGGSQFGGAGSLRRADGSVTFLRSPMPDWSTTFNKPEAQRFVSPGEQLSGSSGFGRGAVRDMAAKPAAVATFQPKQPPVASQAAFNPFLSSMGFQAGNPDFNRRQSAMMAKQMRNWGGPQSLLAAMSVGGNLMYGMDRNQVDRHASDNLLSGRKYTADIGLQGVRDTNAMQRERTAAEERTAAGNQSTQRYGFDQVAASSAAANANERQKIDNAEAAAVHARDGAVSAKDQARFNYYTSQAATARTPQERQYFQQQAESILNPGATPRSSFGNNSPMDAIPFGAREQVQNMIASGASPNQMRMVMRAAGMAEDQIDAVANQANPTSFARPSARNPGGTFFGELVPQTAGEWLGPAAAIPTFGSSLTPQARRIMNNMRP